MKLNVEGIELNLEVTMPPEHSGEAPRDLGEDIKMPPAQYLPKNCTLTRAEYYAYRYGEAPPA